MAITGDGLGFSKYTETDTGSFNDATSVILKEFYQPSVNDLINSMKILSRFIQRNSEDISGRYAYKALNTSRNEGIGFIGERGLLPDPGEQGYNRAIFRMHYNYGRILFTGPSVSATRNDRGSFIRVMDAEIRGMARDIQHENNRVMFGVGNGALATVASTSGTNIVVQNPAGFTSDGDGVQYLRPGMRVAFKAATDGTTWRTEGGGNYSGTVLTVDRATNTITVNANGTGAAATWTLTAGDLVVRVSEQAGTSAPNQVNTSLENEPYGLAAIVGGNPNLVAAFPVSDAAGAPDDRSVFGAIDASSDQVPIWNGVVIDNGGASRPFSQDLIQQGEDEVAQVSGYQVDMLMTDYATRRAYLNQLIAGKRYPNTMDLDGGWTVLEYNGRPLVVDKDCTQGRLYGLNLNSIMMFTETDFQWMDADGSILHRLPNQDAYQATIYRYWAMGCDARNRNFVITDLTV